MTVKRQQRQNGKLVTVFQSDVTIEADDLATFARCLMTDEKAPDALIEKIAAILAQIAGSSRSVHDVLELLIDSRPTA